MVFALTLYLYYGKLNSNISGFLKTPKICIYFTDFGAVILPGMAE